MINKFEAIRLLVGGNLSGNSDGTNMSYDDGQTPPTEEAIQAKITEVQAEYDSLQYQRDRASQYPSIQDVVVALAEKEEGDDTAWQKITAQRTKVKAENPKPS